MLFLLVFKYFDNSAFHVCGITASYAAALAWFRAGDGEHLVYDLKLDDLADAHQGHKPWKPQERNVDPTPNNL